MYFNFQNTALQIGFSTVFWHLSDSLNILELFRNYAGFQRPVIELQELNTAEKKILSSWKKTAPTLGSARNRTDFSIFRLTPSKWWEKYEMFQQLLTLIPHLLLMRLFFFFFNQADFKSCTTKCQNRLILNIWCLNGSIILSQDLLTVRMYF